MLGRANLFLTVALPDRVSSAVLKVFGERVHAFFGSMKNYVFGRHPLLQIMYVVLVIPGFVTFVIYAYPSLPNQFMDGYHKNNGYVLFVLCVTLFYLCCTVSPGVITEGNIVSP